MDGAHRPLRIADAASRRDFLAAHTLVRRALTACDPSTSAEDWHFVYDENGRPGIVGAEADLRFSLTHGAGVVACAVARGLDCGVDVEPVGAVGPRRRVLTPEEAALLDDAGDTLAPRLYARLWTLKEAYGKARGLGFLLPFDQLHVTLDGAATLDDRTQPPPGGRWHVEQWLPTARHVAALAVLHEAPRVDHVPGMPD